MPAEPRHERYIVKNFRFPEPVVERLQNIAAIDPDRSENQVVTRLIRNIHSTILKRLPDEAKQRFLAGTLDRETYDTLNAAYNAKKAAE
jgi:hypothetical protein